MLILFTIVFIYVFLCFISIFVKLGTTELTFLKMDNVSKMLTFFGGIQILHVLAICLLFQIFPMQGFLVFLLNNCFAIAQKKLTQSFHFFLIRVLKSRYLFLNCRTLCFIFLQSASFFSGLRCCL